MNLLQEIYDALSGKEYDDFAKIRWIYLYVCEKFSYDMRFIYAFPSMKREIYNKEINLENVEDFEIVCYTMARILVNILKEFGYESEIERDKDKSEGFVHVYVVVKHGDYRIKLDPTIRHDITRVKMSINTIDFESLENDDFFSDKLLQVDKKVAQDFNGLYFSKESIRDYAEKIIAGIDMYAAGENLSKSEVFFMKLDALYKMVNSRTDLKRYDDIDFYYSYLLNIFKFNTKYYDGVCRDQPVRPAILFNINDRSMRDIINISYVQYGNLTPMFYLLRKEGESFKVREIFRDEALDLLSQYECWQCQNLLEETAKKLSTGKQNGIIH